MLENGGNAMLLLFYILVIAFSIAGGIVIRKKGIEGARKTAAALMIGGGIALCACPFIFGEDFILFDCTLQHSTALPVLVFIAVGAMVWFAFSALCRAQ